MCAHSAEAGFGRINSCFVGWCLLVGRSTDESDSLSGRCWHSARVTPTPSQLDGGAENPLNFLFPPSSSGDQSPVRFNSAGASSTHGLYDLSYSRSSGTWPQARTMWMTTAAARGRYPTCEERSGERLTASCRSPRIASVGSGERVGRRRAIRSVVPNFGFEAIQYCEPGGSQ